MSKGALFCPSTTRTNPEPAFWYAEKSTVCVASPEAVSVPCTTVRPEAVTAPDALRNCQVSGRVAAVTTVARLGPSGR
jgi:hypothetical protein